MIMKSVEGGFMFIYFHSDGRGQNIIYSGLVKWRILLYYIIDDVGRNSDSIRKTINSQYINLDLKRNVMYNIQVDTAVGMQGV